MNGPTHFRAHARFRIELGGTLSSTSRPLAHEVRIRDLGLGGAGLELSTASLAAVPAFAVDAEVTLVLRAPMLWDPLALPGRIAWLRDTDGEGPLRVGVCFDHADSGKVYALFQLLSAPAFDR